MSSKIFSYPFLFPSSSWTPIIQRLVCLILSQRSLRLSSVLFILFTLFCSSEVISNILSSSSLIHFSASDILLLIPSSSVQFSSVAQSCLTLCDPMNCSTPGLPVHHQLLEFAQIHVHRVSDAIQPSHPLSSFSSCPQSFPASESFPMSQLFV